MSVFRRGFLAMLRVNSEDPFEQDVFGGILPSFRLGGSEAEIDSLRVGLLWRIDVGVQVADGVFVQDFAVAAESVREDAERPLFGGFVAEPFGGFLEQFLGGFHRFLIKWIMVPIKKQRLPII